MAKEKKPSIYVDRGTIGSHDELDEYGVWVKSEPQDLSFTGTDSGESLEDFEVFSEDIFEEASGTGDVDIAISDMDDIPDFGSTHEDDSLDFPMEDSTDIVMEDDFDFPGIGEEYEESLPGGEKLETIDFEELEDISTRETVSLGKDAEFDDPLAFEETSGLEENAEFDETIGFEESAGLEETITFDEDAGFDEAVSFDETTGLEETVEFEETADSLDLPEELSLEDSEEYTDTAILEPGGDEDFTEIVIEDLAEPQDTEAASDLPFPQELDDDNAADAARPEEQVFETREAAGQSVSGDSSSMTLSTQLLMKIADELSSIRSELRNLKRDFSIATPAASVPAPATEEEDDEKIALTGDELSTIISTESDETGPDQAPAEEKESRFFDEEDDDKIALTGDELSTILSTESDETEADQAPVEEKAEAFIDEDEDEKIALTGDELSNILNTADFTEEAGADAAMELSEDIDIQETEDSPADFAEADTVIEEDDSLETMPEPLDMELSLEEADLEDLELEYSREETHVEELEVSGTGTGAELDESFESIETSHYLDSADFETSLEELERQEETLPDVSFDEEPLPGFEETEELVEIQETGIEPITFAPDAEDAEYLTEDPLSEDPLSFDEMIDLSEAVIDEPDLSSELQDNPVEEPSLEDISIDLDLEEDISIPEEILDEGTADLDSELEVFEEEIELSMDISEDISDSALIEEDTPAPFEFEDSEEINELSSDHSSSSSEDGGDLSLIPEGFVVDAAESDSVEIDSMETVSAELISTEFPDFPEDSAEDSATEELEAEELEIELGSPEFDVQELDSLDSTEFDTAVELDSEVEEEAVEAEIESDTVLDSEVEFDSDDDIISMDDIDDFVTETDESVEEIVEIQDEPPLPAKAIEAVVEAKALAGKTEEIPSHLKKELKTVLSYMDQLLESLPDEKIEEFAKSEYYDTYKKLFKELGLV